MPPIIQFLIIVAVCFLGYHLLFNGLKMPEFFSKTKACYNCEGKGYWYGAREREHCKVCDGTGRLEKK